MSDRFSLKIGDITFKLAPLSYLQKQSLSECTRVVNGEDVLDLLKAQVLYIKYALKEVDGLEDYAGNKYQLSFDGDVLTDDCVSEILCLEEKEKLTISAWQLLNGLSELKDPVTGKKLSGVKLEVESGN